jgi:enamine deaminase RidA (YjgF/YER057c/UK114 family)
VNSIQAHHLSDNVSYSCFSTEAGCDELFIAIKSTEGASFMEALAELNRFYSDALAAANLSDETVLFSRLFLSDIINQKDLVAVSPVYNRLKKGAVSVIEQKPAGSGPLSLFSYHVRGAPGGASGAIEKKTLDQSPGEWNSTLSVWGKNYGILLTTNYTSDAPFDAHAQTRGIFNSIDVQLKKNGMQLLDSTIRTWIYVRDVDNHYKSMVTARREYFAAQGLTNQTRYLASTGIEGKSFSPERIVTVDSLSYRGLAAGQIVRMEAPSHLSPTIVYGVTFERGLRVRFGDRSHLYISGTASIDNKGDVLFCGDVERQTHRTLENLSALLKPHGATLADMAYMLVYVRNFHEIKLVKKVLVKEIGDTTPVVFAEAAVCRPTWLMEIEGVAVIPDTTNFPAFL